MPEENRAPAKAPGIFNSRPLRSGLPQVRPTEGSRKGLRQRARDVL